MVQTDRELECFLAPWIRTPSFFSNRECFPLGEYAVFHMKYYSILERAYIHAHAYMHSYTHTYMHVNIYRYNIHTNIHTNKHTHIDTYYACICIEGNLPDLFFCRWIHLASIRLILKRCLLKWGLVYFLCESHCRTPAHRKQTIGVHVNIHTIELEQTTHTNTHSSTYKTALHTHTHKLHTHKHTQG